ncbi:MAG: DUF177 domain-containing protein [Chlorobiaceae bacterium]|nr:DUF177 domain-containing protein [Chlorobiaceae bacterium]
MHKEKALIEIPLAGLVQETHEFDFTCKARDFRDQQFTDAGFTDEVHVRATVGKREREVTVAIEASADADFTCDICLSPVSKTLDGTFCIYYVCGEPPEEEQIGDEEYRILDSNAIAIDITEDVRETLLLSIPMKVTCPDNPECRLYRSEEVDQAAQPEETSSWHESLEKLKNKYC